MIRSFIAFFVFWYQLFRLIPTLRLAQKLDAEGKIAERDAIIVPGVIGWGKSMVSLTGSTVTVVGEENIPKDIPVVFVGNHQGNMDIPIFLGYINKPKAFISKIEILKVPLISHWMKLMQCTFLDRKDMRQSVRAMQEAVETVKKGYSLVIFPEGTRSRGGPVAEFKAGSLKLAFKAGVPIVPVTMDGSWRILEEKGVVQPSSVTVTIHPPIQTEGVSREEAAEMPMRIQSLIESAIKTPARIIEKKKSK